MSTQGYNFIQKKCANVTFKKNFRKSKNISRGINTEITEFKQNNIYEYIGINEVNGINHGMNKELN